MLKHVLAPKVTISKSIITLEELSGSYIDSIEFQMHETSSYLQWEFPITFCIRHQLIASRTRSSTICSETSSSEVPVAK